MPDRRRTPPFRSQASVLLRRSMSMPVQGIGWRSALPLPGRTAGSRRTRPHAGIRPSRSSLRTARSVNLSCSLRIARRSWMSVRQRTFRAALPRSATGRRRRRPDEPRRTSPSLPWNRMIRRAPFPVTDSISCLFWKWIRRLRVPSFSRWPPSIPAASRMPLKPRTTSPARALRWSSTRPFP